MPDPELGTLYTPSYQVGIMINYFHFTGEKTEVQRVNITYLWSLSK